MAVSRLRSDRDRGRAAYRRYGGYNDHRNLRDLPAHGRRTARRSRGQHGIAPGYRGLLRALNGSADRHSNPCLCRSRDRFPAVRGRPAIYRRRPVLPQPRLCAARPCSGRPGKGGDLRIRPHGFDERQRDHQCPDDRLAFDPCHEADRFQTACRCWSGGLRLDWRRPDATDHGRHGLHHGHQSRGSLPRYRDRCRNSVGTLFLCPLHADRQLRCPHRSAGATEDGIANGPPDPEGWLVLRRGVHAADLSSGFHAAGGAGAVLRHRPCSW